jgi:hypothetical protein
MRISLTAVAATVFLAATVTAYAQAPREDSLQDRAPQPGVQRPADPGVVRAPSVAPSRETTGAAAPQELEVAGEAASAFCCFDAAPCEPKPQSTYRSRDASRLRPPA